MEDYVIADFDDPMASASGRFPLVAPTGTGLTEDTPAPAGLRPWGMRNLSVAAPLHDGRAVTVARYDHDRQLAVDASGRPLITMGPTANTTSTVDGEDPPSSEDWHNDFYPDEPLQV